MCQRAQEKLVTILIVLSALAPFFLCSCATVKPMAINGKTETLDTTQESIAIFTVKTSNQYKPEHQPAVYSIGLRSISKDKTVNYGFTLDEPYNRVEHQFNEYILSIDLPPGNYKLQVLRGVSDGPYPHGSFLVPVWADFKLEPNEVVYLGRLEAINRKRENDSEERAGPVIPLITQKITGFYDGTFDVKIYDNYDEDMVLFRHKCPVLQDCTVKKRILIPGNKPL
jgi:hypothetical protein